MDLIKKTRRKVLAYSATVRALNFFVGAGSTMLIIGFGYTGWVAAAVIVVLGFAYGAVGTALMAQDVAED